MGALEDLITNQQQGGEISPLQALIMSGTMQAPPGAADVMSPATANLARHIWRGGRQAQPAAFPPYVQTPEELGQSAIQSAPMLIPGVGGMVSKAVAAAPKAATAGLTLAAILNGTSEAGENGFSEPEPKRSSEIQTAIDAVNKSVEPQRKQVQQLERALARGAIDKKEFDQRVAGPNGPISRAEAKIKEIDAPFQRELTAWETRKSDWNTSQQKATLDRQIAAQNAELPFRQKYPGATNAIMAGGAGLTAGTAAALGLLSRGKFKPVVGATGMGAAEGAITANVPEALDLVGYQPIGGPGWQKTLDQTFGKENLVKTGAEAFLHGSGAGAISYGSSFGPKFAERIKSYFARSPSPPTPPPSSPIPPTGPIAPVGSPSPAAATPQGRFSLDEPAFATALERRGEIVSGGRTFRQASNGQWQEVLPNGAVRWATRPPEAGPLENLMNAYK